VKDFDPKDYMLPEVFRKTDRFAQFGIAAAKMAIEDASIESQIDPKCNSIPVIIGSGLGGILFHEEAMLRYLEEKDPRRVYSSAVARVAPNAVSAFIAMQFKLRGPNITISTACSSGGNAIALACGLIQSGFSDIVVTGGAECPITPVTFAGYQSLRVLSKGGDNGFKTPRPFDKRRDGFVLGEAAGILILEEYKKARSRGAKIYAELKGYASNCGVYHMAAPDPSADDAVDAIGKALKMASVEPNDVDYINAHGTATQLNDACEA
jgi:3-oxoacyl-[acyl-carrier-protein] synthase II